MTTDRTLDRPPHEPEGTTLDGRFEEARDDLQTV